MIDGVQKIIDGLELLDLPDSGMSQRGFDSAQVVLVCIGHQGLLASLAGHDILRLVAADHVYVILIDELVDGSGAAAF